MPVFKLPQLAVLATAPVITAMIYYFFIVLGLALDAQTYAGNSLTSRLGNVFATLFTVLQTFTARQLTTGMTDRVLDGGVNLVLYCAVFRKSTSHQDTLIIAAVACASLQKICCRCLVTRLLMRAAIAQRYLKGDIGSSPGIHILADTQA